MAQYIFIKKTQKRKAKDKSTKRKTREQTNKQNRKKNNGDTLQARLFFPKDFSQVVYPFPYQESLLHLQARIIQLVQLCYIIGEIFYKSKLFFE